MSAHTPGPWKVASAAACAEVEVLEIAEVSHYRVIPAAGGWPNAGAPEDDARLIAAAPDLLAELEWIRACISRYDPPGLPNHIATRIDAVVARATGERP